MPSVGAMKVQSLMELWSRWVNLVAGADTSRQVNLAARADMLKQVDLAAGAMCR